MQERVFQDAMSWIQPHAFETSNYKDSNAVFPSALTCFLHITSFVDIILLLEKLQEKLHNLKIQDMAFFFLVILKLLDFYQITCWPEILYNSLLSKPNSKLKFAQM